VRRREFTFAVYESKALPPGGLAGGRL